MEKRYVVTEEDGRVKRTVAPGKRVLVAVPGQVIPWKLAEELGLVKEVVHLSKAKKASAAEAGPPAPAKKAEKKDAPAKKAAPLKTVQYPTKPSSS